MRLTIFGLSLPFLLLGGLLTACDHGSSGGTGSSVHKTGDGSPLDRKLRAAVLRCAIPGGCPENVGLVAVAFNDYTGMKLGQCTGFLIADNIFATNSHCIPKTVKENPQECSSFIKIRFSGGAHPQDIYSCKRLIDASKQGVFDSDYAFVEIESTGRVPLVIAREGVHDGQTLKAVIVTPFASGIMGGSIESSSCNVVLNSLLNFRATTPWSVTGLVTGCRAVHGNSGSPLENERGEVVGIIQSLLDAQAQLVLAQVFAQVHLKMPDQFPINAQFTNLTCVPDPISNDYRRRECEEVAKFSAGSCRKNKIQNTTGSEAELFKAWKATLPLIFKYKYALDVARLTNSAEPICVLTPEQASAARSIYIHREGMIGFRQTQLTADYDGDLKISISARTDANYVIQPESDVTDAGRTSHAITLRQIDSRWVGTDTAKSRMFDFLNPVRNFDLPECTAGEVAAPEVTMIQMPDGESISETDFMARENARVRSPLCD